MGCDLTYDVMIANSSLTGYVPQAGLHDGYAYMMNHATDSSCCRRRRHHVARDWGRILLIYNCLCSLLFLAP